MSDLPPPDLRHVDANNEHNPQIKSICSWAFRSATALITVAASLLLACGAQGQGIPRADAITFFGTEHSAAQLKKAVFAVHMQGSRTNEWQAVGSGFFVQGSNNVVLGVTCKHVVLPFIQGGKELFVGVDSKQGYLRLSCKIPYIDPTNDVAILAPQGQPGTSEQVQNVVFTKDLFDDGSSLVEGRGVIIPGYPLSLGVEDDQNHPVIRIGIVAQFTGKDHFLIDGVASHGSSGSPVFTQKAGGKRLIGMVTSHVADKISLLDERGQLTAQLPYNSGLARALTMKMIQQALDNALGKY
jgi:hypothetical protein